LSFEPGSSVSVLGKSAFQNCGSLHSICLPSSLETLSTFCFRGCRKLSDLAFEPGSQLSDLGESAFADCSSLKSICLPASVCHVSGLALADSKIRSVIVEPESRFLRVSGDFLADSAGSCLFRYFGNGKDLQISSDIKCISNGCFNRCSSICSVRFASCSRISALGESAFRQCESLESICIPSSVETIG
jgi:hypothetical protein